MTQTRKRLLILLAIVAVLLALWFLTPLGEMVDFRMIFENRASLLNNVNEHYLLAVLIFIAVYILSTSLSLPGATVLTLLGGFFFGPWLGTIYVNIGATTGAFIIFLAARFFLGEGLQKKYAVRLAKFNRDIEENGPNYMLTLRLIPLFPFFLVNLFAGFTTIRPKQFLWTTALGIIPGSLAYTWLGHAGATIGEGAPWQLFVAVGLLAALSLLPVLLRKLKKNRGVEIENTESGS